MKLEDQVVSIELAKEMKELGAGQDSLWCWAKCIPGDEYELTLTWDLDLRQGTYAAHTVAELGEMLPGRIQSIDNSWCYVHTTKLENTNEGLIAYYHDELKSNTEATARAKMVIYLIKAGYIKAKEIGK